MTADLDAAKAQARLMMRARRAKIAPGDAAQRLATHFPGTLRALSPVAFYWPVGSEIDPRPLASNLAQGGATLCLPRVATRDGPAQFLAWRHGAPLEADAFGVPAPHADAEACVPRLVLAPLLAFDRAGRRLGQGGGQYDRIIARLHPLGCVIVGLAYAEQEMDSVPAGAHDAPLDWLITPEGALRCGG
jgi:5-formyltetrahydrofolate cyclo-ligase